MLSGPARSPDRRILGAVWTPLVALVIVLAVLLGLWAAWRTVRDQPVILRQLIFGGVIEGLLVVQAVVAGATAATGGGPRDTLTFWGYVLTSLLILPIAAAWAFAERSRWSSVVLLVAALTVAFLQLRLVQVWGAA